ncbi:hypothetical protein SLS62_004321 [Diatrype stigma]|uniref:Uncharacterized protein n=1 Tax=Diatrype stigma TaxID=117547 RepID=A0AAN9V559_9PEZI
MQFTITALTAAAAMTMTMAGLSAAAPATLEERFASGACGIHVNQWQKNENGVGGQYQFEVVIRDALSNIVGGTSKGDRLSIADLSSASLPSALPYQLVISVGAVDSDPVQFSYAGQTWSSSRGCSTGAYDSGKRQMDCGFTC